MKLLWANSGFLHPTTRGGQIRTLEMLRQLHRRHEIHYAALWDGQPEGVARAAEYSTRAFPVAFRAASKRSPRFAMEVVAGVFSNLPLAIGRWRSPEMQNILAKLIREESYDAMVCDFLVTAVNFPEIEKAVLFQHNVESVIWERHAETATDAPRRKYFAAQARRMGVFEADICRRAARVVAVSESDAAQMSERFGVVCSAIPTGVDIEYFSRSSARGQGLVFVGSMDWMPNVDGITWFTQDILPLIRAVNRTIPVTIVGRAPPPGVQALAASDPHLHVTGTVPDVRPYLWNAAVSIVPLRIGGGTRIKIYEAMAAGVPVVSTTIGAEGLDVRDGQTIALADTPADFARRCLELAGSAAVANEMSRAAREMVALRYSWDQVTRAFEQLLLQAQEPATP